MEVELWILACLCAAYFTAGFVDSAAGGGGLISVPALLMAGMPPDLTLGTNKLAVALSMPASIITYARSGFVLWRLAAVGAPASLAGGILGPKTALLFSNEALETIIMILLPMAIVITLIPKKIPHDAVTRDPLHPPYVRTALLCAAIGFYEGFFGPGSGSFFILGLHYCLGAGLIQASATAKVINVSASITALMVFALSGKVIYSIGVPVGMACLLGNVIGTKTAMRVGPAYIKKMLTFVLCLLMASLVWKQLAGSL